MYYITVYLQESQRSGGHDVSPQQTNARIRRIDNLGIPSYLPRHHKPPPSSSDSHPFLAYVRSCGFQHLENVSLREKEVLRAIVALQSVMQSFPLEWERLCGRSGSLDKDWPTLKHDFVLYILIAFAPTPLLSLYIGRPRLEPKEGTNPLTYAAAFRKVEHAKILLSKGVSLNHRGLNIDHRRVLPIEVAVERGDPNMVHLFLTEGSPIPRQLFESAVKEWTRYSARVVSKLLQTDEFVEWATIVWNERRFLSALDPTSYLWPCSPEKDLETIERRLIQIGCNPSSRFNETRLRHAVRAGHVSTVGRLLSLNIPLPPDIILDVPDLEMMYFLLSLGCSVHVTSPAGDTPLHCLVYNGIEEDECLEWVQILVDAGCNPSASNLEGTTPLDIAASTGDVSVVEYLLSLHVPLPSDILLAASGLSMIRLLLDKGADVHATSASGDTVFHAALSKVCNDWDQCSELANILIDAGCDPCSQNVFGETPFNVAAKGGHLPAVKCLLSWNIPLPSDILISAVSGSSLETAQMLTFLIDEGADIHVMSPEGSNLLATLFTGFYWGLVEEESLRMIKVLVNAGCDARSCNAAGETLLHIAARRHDMI